MRSCSRPPSCWSRTESTCRRGLFDPLEWIWLFAALPAFVVLGPTGVKAMVMLVGFVGSTYLVLAIAVHAGRELLLAIREAVRLCTRRSAGTPPR